MKIKNTKEDKKKTVCEDTGKLDAGKYELAFWDLKYSSLVRSRSDQIDMSEEIPHTCSTHLMSFLRPTCVPLAIVLILSLSILSISLLDNKVSRNLALTGTANAPCLESCSFKLVESIPENLTYPAEDVIYGSIYDAWADLLDGAESSVDIAAFYWTLRSVDVVSKKTPSAWMGEDIFDRLNKTGLREGVKMRIAQNKKSHVSPQNDSTLLQDSGAAEVRNVDFDRLINAGVLHTKMWVVDNKHLYLGSANMDWRSLSQVKEVGVVIKNCSCLAQDLKKIFEVYWYLGEWDSSIPDTWPPNFDTQYNTENQMPISFTNDKISAYLSSSPPQFTPDGRTDDVNAIVDVISKADKFVYIAVMDYFPRLLYTNHHKEIFWPIIDNALRAVALEKKVTVHLLGSHWNHTRPDMANWLKSLQELSTASPHIDIKTKLFVVPAFNDEQSEIPFARVNHNKYMVTDNTAYIGTSNWSGDYFVNTGGIGLVVNETMATNHTDETSLRSQLQTLFERDWNSEYAHEVEEFIL